MAIGPEDLFNILNVHCIFNVLVLGRPSRPQAESAAIAAPGNRACAFWASGVEATRFPVSGVGQWPALFFGPMTQIPNRQRLINALEPVCTHAGFELVDLRLVLEQGGWVLRLSIDRPAAPGQAGLPRPDGVSIADCETLSREISAVLDVQDPIPQAFSLEVTSPGLDRPLRTAAHFREFVGAEAKISLAVPLMTAGGERRNFRGTIKGVVDEPRPQAAINVDGQEFQLEIDHIDQARLVPDWDAVMRGDNPYLPRATNAKRGAPKPPSNKPMRPR